MTNPNLQIDSRAQGRIADRVTSKVTDALKGDKAFESGSLALSAHIAGAAAAAVLDIPAEARKELTRRQADLMRGVRRLVETFSEDARHGKIKVPLPKTVEPSKGEGLGPLVSADDGSRLLEEVSIARKIEDWAGPIAGASELSRDYGIARSTLHRWQQSDEVIGLLKGTKKHVFPVEQFIDGRPARGIAAVIELAGGHRATWLWLRQKNSVLGGRRPIDLLKQDRVDDVVDVARSYFDPQ